MVCNQSLETKTIIIWQYVQLLVEGQGKLMRDLLFWSTDLQAMTLKGKPPKIEIHYGKLYYHQ